MVVDAALDKNDYSYTIMFAMHIDCVGNEERLNKETGNLHNDFRKCYTLIRVICSLIS